MKYRHEDESTNSFVTLFGLSLVYIQMSSETHGVTVITRDTQSWGGTQMVWLQQWHTMDLAQSSKTTKKLRIQNLICAKFMSMTTNAATFGLTAF